VSIAAGLHRRGVIHWFIKENVVFISKKLNDALNAQITMEFSAHLQYLAMAVYFEEMSLDRLAGFFYNQAEEEKVHGLKIVRYLSEAGAAVTFEGLPRPKQGFASPTEVAELFLEQEQSVTESFYKMNAQAEEEKDYITHSFLQWFINEQLEEMTTASKLCDLIHMAGDNLLMVEMLVGDLEAAQADSMGEA
jgi:ferritin